MLIKRLLHAIFMPVFLTLSLTLLAQDRYVSGVVTDAKDGSPVVGASVQPKGSKTGTSTGADGKYSLLVPSGINTIEVSSAEYVRQEIDITGKTVVDVVLTASAAGLTEVVVIGYGTARKKDLTGAVASVQAKDFNKGTFTSPDQLIQGKAAGVMVINNTGQPGGSTTVRIRGSSSIRSGNQPLFVIDGVPLSGGSARPGGQGGEYGSDAGNPLNYINPNDIASMEILKDASATAIYGSRGANGVIIINTKRGKSGTPTIDVNASVGASNVLKKLEVLDATEYRKALADYNLPQNDYGSDVDAWDAISRTGLVQNYGAAVSGGTETGRYRLSLGYLDQEGVIENSDFKKYSANLTSSFKFLESKKLGLDINLLVAQTNENIAPISAFVGFTGNLISQALQWNPTRPLYKAGTDSALVLTGSTTINPVAQLDYFEDKAYVTTIIASVAPSYKITNELEYKFLYSINRQVGIRKGQINRLLNMQGIEGRGAAFNSSEEQTNSQIANTLSFNKQITPAFNLNAVVGHEWLIFDTKGSFAQGLDFPNVGLKYYDLLSIVPQSSRSIGAFASPTYELQSFFGRAILNFRDRFIFTGTLRADGSTKFGENNKYGYFPSLALAWNVLQEKFASNSGLFQNLKVRVGWGQTGNQEFPSGASLERNTITSSGGATRVNFANPDLVWETTQTSNVGVDFAIFNNRLTGSIDYFNRKTKDVLYEQTPAAPSPQGTKVWVNLDGEVINKGLEVSLYGTLISNQDMVWNMGANASFLDNVVEGLVGFYQTGELRGQGFSDVRGQRLISGQPLNVWYLRRFEGLDKNTGQSIYADGGNTLFYSGSPNPKTLLGFSTDFSYKKWTATINMNGSFGHYVFNNTAASVLGIGNLNGGRNIAKAIVGGDVKESIANAPAPSTRNLEKGNYFKMANASIAYRVGNVGKVIRNLNLFLTGQNLFVITDYTGFDPEVNTDGGFDGIPSLGIEYIPYPSSRTVQFGVSFSL